MATDSRRRQRQQPQHRNRGAGGGSGSGGKGGTQCGRPQKRQAPAAAPAPASGPSGVRTEIYDQIERLLPSSDGGRRRHPARLVGDAICILGAAQEGIRGKACRRVIKKARAALIAMLDGAGPDHGTGAFGGAQGGGKNGGGGGRRRKR